MQMGVPSGGGGTPSYGANLSDGQMMQATKQNYGANYTTPGSTYGTVNYGSTGANVRRLQSMLGINADGVYGNQTRQAVMNYQRANHLGVDGIVGNQTWQSLLSNHSHVPQSQPRVPTSRNSGSALPVAHKAVTPAVAQRPIANASASGSAINPPTNNGFQDATLADIAKKYGIDISQGYANNQASAQYKGKQDSLNNSLNQDKADYNNQLQQLLNAFNTQKDTINQQTTQNKDLNAQNLKAIADTLNSGLANTDQSYFLKGLDQAQAQENTGINSGLASDQNLRLAMNKQNAVGALDNTASQQKGAENNRYAQQVQSLADALRQANDAYTTQKSGAYNTYTGQTKDLQSQLADLAQQQTATSQQIHQQQLAQALGQLNTVNARNDQNNQFAQSQAWQKYTYTHMSAQEKAQFDQTAKQFGDQMAWNIEQLKQQLATYNSAYPGFNSGSEGGGRTVDVKSTPSSYQSTLERAAQITHLDPSQIPYLNWVVQHESSFNPNAKNPNSSAHGLGQFINSTQAIYDKKSGLNYNSSPVAQLVETIMYMNDKYGSPQGAASQWSVKSGY